METSNWHRREKQGDFAELMREIVDREQMRVGGEVRVVNIERGKLTVWWD